MKVKNVIKGLQKQYDLQEIHIIEPERVVYSGSYTGWAETTVDMILYKKRVENAEVERKLIFNNRKAFIFIFPMQLMEN